MANSTALRTDWACVDRTNVRKNTPYRGRYIAIRAVITHRLSGWYMVAGFLSERVETGMGRLT